MKTKLYFTLSFTFLLCIFFSSTSFSDIPAYRGEYVPVFMKRTELEKSVSYSAQSRDLIQPGKIYYKTPYIYINEKYKGVHIVNNTDPSNPKKEGFITAPGCIDMAVKGNILYLDNAVDLVAFDLDAKKVTERIKNVFPEPIPPKGSYYWSTHNRDEMVIVSWKKSN